MSLLRRQLGSKKGSNPSGPEPSDFTWLWDEMAGSTDYFILDFQNISSWPGKALLRGSTGPAVTAKVEYVRDLTAHACMWVESYVLGEDEQAMARYTAMKKWTKFSAPALPSKSSDSGSHGGTALAIRTYLSYTPIAGSYRDGCLWRYGDGSFYAAAFVHFRSIPVLLFSGYFRRGPDDL